MLFRSDQLRHPKYKKPELLATAPNQVWSWDITKLLGPAKWIYYYLYVILDIYSRYVVGWMLAHRESAEFGVGAFGRDPRNGRALRAWVDRHYVPVWSVGPEPFGAAGFGAVVMRRGIDGP